MPTLLTAPHPGKEGPALPPVNRPRASSVAMLAAEIRDQDWADDLAGGIQAATGAQWRWQDTFLLACRLMIDPDASGRDLLREVQAKDLRHDGRQVPGEPPADALEEVRRKAAEVSARWRHGGGDAA